MYVIVYFHVTNSHCNIAIILYGISLRTLCKQIPCTFKAIISAQVVIILYDQTSIKTSILEEDIYIIEDKWEEKENNLITSII